MAELRPRATPKISVVKWDIVERSFIETFGKAVIGEYLFIMFQV